MENNEVLVEISARHVHLSQKDLETLFGAGYELTKKKTFLSPVSMPARKELRLSVQRESFREWPF